ncbi:hypothetical protein Tco_0143550 [Tanacetum coccineum]
MMSEERNTHKVLTNDDLLTEILIRLPILCIHLFTCVSKQWLTILTFPVFTLKCSQIGNLDPHAGLFVNHIRSSFHCDFVSFDPKIKSGKYTIDNSFTLGSTEAVDNVSILQSCNGENSEALKNVVEDEPYFFTEELLGPNGGSCSGKGGRVSSMAGRGGGWLAKHLILSNEGRGGGGLVVRGGGEASRGLTKQQQESYTYFERFLLKAWNSCCLICLRVMASRTGDLFMHNFLAEMTDLAQYGELQSLWGIGPNRFECGVLTAHVSCVALELLRTTTDTTY